MTRQYSHLPLALPSTDIKDKALPLFEYVSTSVSDRQNLIVRNLLPEAQGFAHSRSRVAVRNQMQADVLPAVFMEMVAEPVYGIIMGN